MEFLKDENKMSIVPLVQLNKNNFYDKMTNLRSPSAIVSDFGSQFQTIVENLEETFFAHKIAVGLAAPQIGIQLRVSVINVKHDRSDPTLVIVNPIVVS